MVCRISKGVCSLQAQSLTICGKAMAGSGSARGSTPCKHNHLLAMGRPWQNQDQQGFCTLRVQSLTSCRKEMAGSGSARGSALCKHNHLLAVGRQWQDQDQQGGLLFASTITYKLWKGNGMIRISKGLLFASTITYKLWEGNGRIRISKEVCTLQAQSLTCCGKAMAG